MTSSASASLSFLVFAQDIPTVVHLKDHGVDFRGRDPDAFKGLISGFFGAHAKQASLVHAAAWAKSHANSASTPSRVLLLDSGYDFKLEESPEETLDNPIWIHTQRITKERRPWLHELWMKWIRKEVSPEMADQVATMSLHDIAFRFPTLIPKTLKANKSLLGIVHPVNPSICPKDTLLVATVRYSPKRFIDPTVRYLDKVVVKV